MRNIHPIRALKDNYIWIMPGVDQTWIVDPGEALPVIEYLNQHRSRLAGILITHHHGDHTAGISELLENYRNIPVYGSALSSNPNITHKLKDGDEIAFLDMRFRAIEIPGHTLDHMAYYGNGILFSGDTLFSAGCGRIFEGTPPQMYASLQKIMQLPEATRLYCGHEYTVANLKFAAHVEPHNQHIISKLNEFAQDDGCTLPSTLKEEKNINPFLRCHIPEVIHAVEQHAGKALNNEVEVFTYLRHWKNQF